GVRHGGQSVAYASGSYQSSLLVARSHLAAPHRLDALQLQRRDILRLHVNDLDAVVIGVGNVYLAPGDAQPARFVEPAQIGFATLLDGVDQFDLAVVGVGVVELTAEVSDAEGVLKADLSAHAVDIAEVEEALADDGG